MADPTISHGWVTAEPDAGFDVDAPNLNDHQITGFGAAVSAVVDPAITTHAGATDPHGDRAFATAAVAALSTVYQPLDSDLTAIAALSTTSYGRAFLALADAAAGRTALGLGTAATQSSGAFDAAGAAAAAQAASQPLDSDLTAIAALTTTSFGRGLLALADAAAARTALGLGTAALSATGDFDAAGAAASAQAASQPLDSDLTAIAALTTTTYGRALLALADAAAGRSALALVIGTDVQGYDADLTAIAGLTSAADKLPYFTGSAAAALADLTTFARSLLDDVNAGAARTTLGLGTAAVAATGDFDAAGAAAAAQAASQPLDSDLTTIGAIAPANDDIIQRKAGAWTNRTIAQLMTDLGIAGSYQPLDSDLTAIAALTTTSFGRSVLDRADAAALRTLAGLGTLATQSGTFSGTSSGTNTGDQTLPTRASLGIDTGDSPQFLALNIGAATDTTVDRLSAGDIQVEGNRIFRVGGTDVPVADGGTGASTASAARTNLGLVIGTDVQAQDAELAALAALTSAADKLPYFTGSGTAALADLSSFIRTLLDDADAATARATLGVTAGGIAVTGCKAYHSTTQAVTGGSTATASFDSEEFDTASYHDTVTNNSRLTVPATGLYMVGGSVYLNLNGVELEVFFRKNGTTDIRGGSLVVGSADGQQAHHSTIVSLTAGDYLEMRVFAKSSGNIGSASAATATEFWIYRLT